MPEVSSVDLTALRKIAAAELRLLWVNDWYDGPLEAVVEHEGERLLMVLHGEGAVDVERPMRWALFRLTPEQWAEEEKWHALFEQHVGHHWCLHHETTPDAEPEAHDTARFYEPHAARVPRALDASTAVGWIDEIPTG